MMKFLALLTVFHSAFVFAEGKPYKIVVYADAAAVARAKEFVTYLKKKPPFSKMDKNLVIDVVTMTKEEMDCKTKYPEIPRLITCNHAHLTKKLAEAGGNLSLAFTSNGSGGSGGNIPVATVDYPIQTMFHEMLHTYGLADEYNYSPDEQKIYCSNPYSYGNIAYFKDFPPYSNDGAARAKHASEIPWYGGIPASKLITTGTSLGSASGPIRIGSQTMGIYRGGSCDSEKTLGWRPYDNSIMRGYVDDTIYPLYEEIIVKNIESSIGRKLQLPPPEVTCLQNESLNGILDLEKDIENAVRRIQPPHNHAH